MSNADHNQPTVRKHWSHWPWSMIPTPLRRRVGHGVIVLRGPKRFVQLDHQLAKRRSAIGLSTSIFTWSARKRRVA